MTEQQTPKLDVQTLEYVLSMVEKKRDQYEKQSDRAEEDGFMVRAEKEYAKWFSMTCLKNEIKRLIREQQEA